LLFTIGFLLLNYRQTQRPETTIRPPTRVRGAEGEDLVVDLNDFRYFVEVVDRGGFASAGRALDRSTSTISFRIQQLERELGLTLLARTSRRLNMTPAGEEFYHHAATMLERASEAVQAMRGRTTNPAGVVRYTVGVSVAQFAMTEMILSFMAEHPKVELVQHTSDTQVDIVANGYDFAIRAHTGQLPDCALVQKRLADVPWHLFAAPSYLNDAGRPRSPEELQGRATLFMKRDQVQPVWHLRRADECARLAHVPLQPRMLGACVVTLKRAAEGGLGVVALPAYHCRDEVRSGRLERVLPEWVAADSYITALMPNRRGLSAAARAFIDHLGRHFVSAVQFD
jgi:DNA-binding transcriptional LysR family regulator